MFDDERLEVHYIYRIIKVDDAETVIDVTLKCLYLFCFVLVRYNEAGHVSNFVSVTTNSHRPIIGKSWYIILQEMRNIISFYRLQLLRSVFRGLFRN